MCVSLSIYDGREEGGGLEASYISQDVTTKSQTNKKKITNDFITPTAQTHH